MIKKKGNIMIEAMISIAAGSVVMLLAIQLVHQALKLSVQTRQHATETQTLSRLARQFRSDIHSAVSWDTPSQDQMRIQFPDGAAIVYQFENHHVVRKLVDRLQIPSHESYSIAEDSLVKFDRLASPDRCVLSVERQSRASGQTPLLNMQVAAIAGRWIDPARAPNKEVQP
jgi:hypothetical protein